uniref:Uncharacterized protein n=1 Tax=Myoviridae sp. ctiBE32 TaxID=2826685 RepID=A0A8S5N818_9CAUD|nr:MAG TPA: hypothetical protein [Myoviridae sp. ctiBE32]
MAETKAYIQELADKDGNKVYPVTKAEAVYMADNTTTLDKQIENMQQSFQDGVDTLVNKLKSLGVTPEENSPAGIATAIDVLAQNKFNDGVASIKIPATVSITTNGGAGQENYDIADGYYTEAVVDQSGAYNAGRLQGREDVKANPNGYGFYTEDQYNAFGELKFSEGTKAVQADPGAYNLTTHGSKTEFFQAAYDGGTITLRRTTGGIDDNMGSQYCGDGNGQVTGGYTFKW